jgi:hypothetical protein
LAILDEQNQKAVAYAQLSDRTKDILEGQRQVLTGINKTIQGVIETAQTLVSGPFGALGTVLIGAGIGLEKLGNTAHETGTFFTEMSLSAAGLGLVFKDATGVAMGLASEFGSIEEATFGIQLKTNMIAQNMGLGGEAAASLVGSFARLNEGSADSALDMMQFTQNLAKANNVAPTRVMQDIAGSAEAFAKYGKEGGENIAIAAVSAAKLGVSMRTLEGIADNLLDFESSITKELELSAMLGRNINLNRARALAYEGELGAATKETLRQLGGVDAFNRMDVIQKQQSADLLGISVAELQKMADNYDRLNDDGSIQLTNTEAVGAKFDMIAQTLKGIGTGPGGDFLKMLGSGAIAMGQMGFPLSDIYTKTKGIAQNIKNWVVGGVTKMFSGTSTATQSIADATKKTGGGLMSKIFGKTTDATKSLGDATKQVPDTSAGTKGTKGMTSAIQGIKPGQLLAGAAALAITAGAVWVFGKAVQEFMEVSWSAVGKAIVSMAALVAGVVALGVVMSSGVGTVAILAGAAAMLVIAGSIWVLGKAIQEMAVGFGAMDQVGSVVSNLVSMLPQIGALTFALAGLAGSLALLGTAGLLALPALMGLSMASEGLGIVANILGVGGETGAVEKESLSEYQTQMLSKMDRLIEEVAKNRDVYMDSEKVTNVIVKQSERKTENIWGLGVA